VVKVQKSQVGSVSGGINAVSGLNTLTFGIKSKEIYDIIDNVTITIN
jgi:hypothetical protein